MCPEVPRQPVLGGEHGWAQCAREQHHLLVAVHVAQESMVPHKNLGALGAVIRWTPVAVVFLACERVPKLYLLLV